MISLVRAMRSVCSALPTIEALCKGAAMIKWQDVERLVVSNTHDFAGTGSALELVDRWPPCRQIQRLLRARCAPRGPQQGGHGAPPPVQRRLRSRPPHDALH